MLFQCKAIFATARVIRLWSSTLSSLSRTHTTPSVRLARRNDRLKYLSPIRAPRRGRVARARVEPARCAPPRRAGSRRLDAFARRRRARARDDDAVTRKRRRRIHRGAVARGRDGDARDASTGRSFDRAVPETIFRLWITPPGRDDDRDAETDVETRARTNE